MSSIARNSIVGSPIARQALSALGVLAIVGVLSGGAVSAFLGLREDQANVAALEDQAQALDARVGRLGSDKPSASDASPFLQADTITLAGAVLQQRVENAVAAVGGRLASSRVEVGGGSSKNQVALEAELTLAQPATQQLLYDLETGKPYLFVDSFEARSSEDAESHDPQTRLSFKVTGEWGGAK